MPEPVFLLILMVLTGLGVWTFLGQLSTGRLTLPRLRKLRLSLPKLAAKRRPRPGRTRPRAGNDFDLELENDDAGLFSPALSTFRPDLAYLAAAAPSSSLQPEEDDAYEYDDDEPLPNQVDFFAAVDDEAGHPGRPPISSSRAPAVDGASADPGVQPAPVQEQPGTEHAGEAAPVFQVAAEPEPNDIMSFFDKPAATTQLPEALRDTLETVSAAQLLAEARQLRALLSGRKDAA